MSESGEKTEQPTAKKLRDSKKKGQVPQTKQAVSMVVVIIGCFYTYFTFGTQKNWLVGLLDYCLDFSGKSLDTFRFNGKGLLTEFLVYMIFPLPVLITAFVILATQMIAGGVFSLESMKFKPEKFNPAKNLKNMFSLSSLYNLVFGLVMGGYAYIVGSSVFKMFKSSLTYSIYCGLECEAAVVTRLVFLIIVSFALLMFVFILLDIKIQKMLHIKNLKMTKDEVKREHKQSEGDPMLKGERKNIARENVQGPRPSDIAFVVAGSEISLGFLFDNENYQVPYLAFKGRAEGARRMVQFAQANRRPVDFSDALVKHILKNMKQNNYAPRKLFPVMREIIQRHGL